MRSGIRVALENADFDVVAEAANGPDAVREAIRTAPDLCIVDLYMPRGGVETIREMHRRLPRTLVVVLTVSTSDEDMFDSLAAGAAGFVPKETSADRLPAVLRGGLAGDGARGFVPKGAPGGPPARRAARRARRRGRAPARDDSQADRGVPPPAQSAAGAGARHRRHVRQGIDRARG